MLAAWLYGLQYPLVGPPLLPKLQYLNNYLLDCLEMFKKQLRYPDDES